MTKTDDITKDNNNNDDDDNNENINTKNNNIIITNIITNNNNRQQQLTKATDMFHCNSTSLTAARRRCRRRVAVCSTRLSNYQLQGGGNTYTGRC